MATPPRLILPGATHLVTRRCSERRLFLRPSAVTNAIVLYALAVAAERYGVLLHAFCVLSNHLHLVLTDPRARLPDFERYFDSLVAKAVNCSLGRWESFWAPDSYSAVRLETTESILEKIVYTLANPVAAGLVPHGRDWPGLWSDPDLFGGAGVEVKRPDIYFRRNGQMPASVRLQLTPPPGFSDHASFVELVRTRLAEAEREAADRLHEEGRTFLGRRGVLVQKPFSRPAPGEPRRRLSPRVACRDKWKRIEALQRLVEFRRARRHLAHARPARGAVHRRLRLTNTFPISPPRAPMARRAEVRPDLAVERRRRSLREDVSPSLCSVAAFMDRGDLGSDRFAAASNPFARTHQPRFRDLLSGGAFLSRGSAISSRAGPWPSGAQRWSECRHPIRPRGRRPGAHRR